ncbi:hypothetical protein B0J17DRAFT_107238 [Rhizoctonia solani]|nr:hypothetical protein B0J17DRAFT_107238 [Rhizoctonia solani]
MPLDALAARDTIISQYVTVSGLALLLYDYLLTLPIEVELVWPAKISPVKCAFLVNRYMCPLALVFVCAVNSGHWRGLDDKVCQRTLSIVSAVEPLLLVVGTFIICTRVYCIWGSHRIAFWVLSACWTIHLVVDVILVTLFGALDMTHVHYLPEYNLCVIEKHHSWAALLNSMVLHTILVFISCIFGFRPQGTQKLVSCNWLFATDAFGI